MVLHVSVSERTSKQVMPIHYLPLFASERNENDNENALLCRDTRL